MSCSACHKQRLCLWWTEHFLMYEISSKRDLRPLWYQEKRVQHGDIVFHAEIKMPALLWGFWDVVGLRGKWSSEKSFVLHECTILTFTCRLQGHWNSLEYNRVWETLELWFPTSLKSVVRSRCWFCGVKGKGRNPMTKRVDFSVPLADVWKRM